MLTKSLLAAALTLAAPALAQAPVDNAAARAAAQAFDEAQQKGDAVALDKLLAPDFLLIRASGRIGDRRDFIAGFTAPGSTLDPFVITDRLFVRVAPDVAIAGGEARVSGVENGKRFAEHFRYSDTFALRDGRWLAVFTQVTPLPAE